MEDMDIDDYSRDRSRSPVRNRSRSPAAKRDTREERSEHSYGSSDRRDRERRDRDYGGSRRGGRGGSRGGRGGFHERRGGRYGSRDRGDRGDRDFSSSKRDYVSKNAGVGVTSTADPDDYRSKIERNYDNSIFIGNIPFDATAKDVEEIFRGDCQIVRADIVTNRGQSRGMATVEFSNKEDVHKAISKFDRFDYNGRQIFVRQDYPPPGEKRDRRDFTSSTSSSSRDHDNSREDRSRQHRERDNYREQSFQQVPRERELPKPGTEIFIGNLPFSVNWQALKDIMREAGEVVRADVRMDNWGRSRGFGTVVFKTEEEAAAAVEKFQGYVLEGRSLDARPGKVYNSGNREGTNRSSHNERERDGNGHHHGASSTASAPEPIRNTEFTEGVAGHGERSNTIYAANLPWVTNVDDLYELFETIGRVTKAEIQYNEHGKPSGNAVIEFELEELADLAISNLNGYNYGGRDLEITYAKRQGGVAAGQPEASEAPEAEMTVAETQPEEATPVASEPAPVAAEEAPAVPNEDEMAA